MSTSANKRRKLFSVLCSSSSDEVKSQQGHIGRLRLARNRKHCVRSRQDDACMQKGGACKEIWV